MQRYIVQTIYRVDIISYRYHPEKYGNFDISLSFRYRFNIGETMSMLSIYLWATVQFVKLINPILTT